MDVATTRFGTLSAQEQDFLVFEQGLIGLEDCRRWVLLADGQNTTLGWLQSIDRGEIALGIVSPRRFVPDYQLRVDSSDLNDLQLSCLQDAQVIVVVSRQQEGLSLNLRAPLVINVQNGLSCQVVAKDNHPVRHLLTHDESTPQTSELRKIA